MKRILKWLMAAGLVLLLVLGAGVWAVQRWIGTEDFKTRVEQQAGTALGLPVQLARLEVAVWPLPAVAVEGVQIQTRPALTLERLEVRPAWRALLQGRLELSTVLVRGALLPQVGIDAMLLALQKKKQPVQAVKGLEAENAENFDYIPRRTVLDHVTWVSAKGARIVLDADAQLSPQGLPDDVSIKILQGQWHGATLRLQRQTAEAHDWTLAMAVGGGTVQGNFQWQPAAQAGAVFSLKGQLQTRAVEVAALSGTPQPVLSGALDADTTLAVRSASLGAVPEALQTQSKFTVRQAVVHGVDLAKAVKTVGLSRGGETPLDTLSGQVTTQGRALQLTQLAASSGVLSASGQVAVAPSRALSGRVNVDLGGAVGVPLAVGGTLDAPEVTLTRAAMIGAAIGTVVLPGVGTGAGASLGDKVGAGFNKLFGR
ncbi:MAG: AsmA family protein [Pseudomonadota bacterium]